MFIEDFHGLRSVIGITGEVSMYSLTQYLNNNPHLLDEDFGKREFNPNVVCELDDNGSLVLELWHDNKDKIRSYSAFIFPRIFPPIEDDYWV